MWNIGKAKQFVANTIVRLVGKQGSASNGNEKRKQKDRDDIKELTRESMWNMKEIFGKLDTVEIDDLTVDELRHVYSKLHESEVKIRLVMSDLKSYVNPLK